MHIEHIDLRDISTTKIGVFESFLSSDNAIAKAVIEPPIVLAVNVTLGVESADLAAEPCRKFRGIEPINRADAALTSEQLLVVGVDVVSKDGDEPHSGDHHPLLRILFALGRSDSGGGGG